MSRVGSYALEAVPLTVCVYVATFVLPLRWDISLLVLVAGGVVAMVLTPPVRPPRLAPLDALVTLFVSSVALSIVTSQDPERSVEATLMFLPALLIYVLTSRYFFVARHFLYLHASLSVTALYTGCALLCVAWTDPGGTSASWVATLGFPPFVVPNDVALLYLISAQY
jgi:hypothetical protein